MKRLAAAILSLGALQASLWAWAPVVVRWQSANALERYGSLGSLETVMQVFQDSMHATYIEAAVGGAIMLVAAVLILRKARTGWNLWLLCLGISMTGTAYAFGTSGPSLGLVTRLVLLLALATSTVIIARSGGVSAWFKGGPPHEPPQRPGEA